MANVVRIVVAEPGKVAVIKTIADTLDAMQAEIGGNLESSRIAGLRSQGIHCYVNEDGIRLGLKPNLPLSVFGNIVASKADSDGEEVGFTEEEAEFARIYLNILRGME